MPGNEPAGDTERFIWKPGDATLERVDSQCLKCKHYHPSRGSCEAFPDVTPGPIFSNRHDHRQPYTGDQGIRWEPREPGVIHPLDNPSSQG